MVSPLVLLFLLLPVYVEDSSASTLLLTRIRRHASPISSKETGGTEESNPINSFAVSSTAFPKDEETTTLVYSETDSENYTDNRSSLWNLETEVSSEAPEPPVNNSYDSNLTTSESSEPIEETEVSSELPEPRVNSNDSNLTTTESPEPIQETEVSSELPEPPVNNSYDSNLTTSESSEPIEETEVSSELPEPPVNNSYDSNLTTTESSEPIEETEVLSEPPEPLVNNSNDSILTTTESSEPEEETEVSSSTVTTKSEVTDSSDGSESTIDSIDFFTHSMPDSTDVSTSDTLPDMISDTSPDSPDSNETIPDTTPDTSDTTTTDTPSTDLTTDSTTTDSTTTDSTTTDSTTADSTTIDSTTTDSTTTDSTPTDPSTEPPTEEKLQTGLIIGIIVPILLIGIGIVLLTAHRYGKLRWPPQNLFSNGLADPIRPQPVTLKKFPAHCSDMLNVTSKLSHEYQLLATLSVDIYATESFVAGQLPDNKSKNRYVNILPFDSTRVKLAPEGDDFYSDYINASYIKGYTNEIEYIATQGPKEDTCRDFWKMVYQEPIKVIVMVTQLEEQGKPKCYKYFPNLRENLEFEDIIVRCTTELHFPIYTSRTLILTKGERKRSIIHLHFREWPDFGCPATPDLMLQFCQVMRHNIVLAQPGITLIHCSAGVGRTGTLIAVDILLQHIKENKKIDIFGTVYKLRKHRMNMVQSEAQYVYIYKCIKEALEDPSYLSSENSSTTSLEPIYENIECTRLSTASSKIIPDTVVNESECAL